MRFFFVCQKLGVEHLHTDTTTNLSLWYNAHAISELIGKSTFSKLIYVTISLLQLFCAARQFKVLLKVLKYTTYYSDGVKLMSTKRQNVCDFTTRKVTDKLRSLSFFAPAVDPIIVGEKI